MLRVSGELATFAPATVRSTFTVAEANPLALIPTDPVYFPLASPVVLTETVTVVPLGVAESHDPPEADAETVPSVPFFTETLTVWLAGGVLPFCRKNKLAGLTISGGVVVCACSEPEDTSATQAQNQANLETITVSSTSLETLSQQLTRVFPAWHLSSGQKNS
jgi:acetolactate synthase regulatory subunit